MLCPCRQFSQGSQEIQKCYLKNVKYALTSGKQFLWDMFSLNYMQDDRLKSEACVENITYLSRKIRKGDLCI